MIAKVLYSLENITKNYTQRDVVRIEELSINKGELFAFVGPSGAGKSTILYLLDFLQAPTTGQISFRDKPISLPIDIKLQREIGMVFQRTELLFGTVRFNIEYPLKLRGMQNEKLVNKTMSQLDLATLTDSQAHTLSGGEVQRVALARTLVTQPEVLLLDEPTANLDPYNVELIEAIIREQKEQGKTILLVTHNVSQAKRLADRVGLMLNGELVEVSGVDKFFNNPSDERALAFVRGQMVY